MSFIIITTIVFLGILGYIFYPTIKYHTIKWYDEKDLKGKHRIIKMIIGISITLYYISFYFATRNMLPDYTEYINFIIQMVLATFIFLLIMLVVILIEMKDFWGEEDEEPLQRVDNE